MPKAALEVVAGPAAGSRLEVETELLIGRAGLAPRAHWVATWSYPAVTHGSSWTPAGW